jgi:hypothetical protein
MISLSINRKGHTLISLSFFFDFFLDHLGYSFLEYLML